MNRITTLSLVGALLLGGGVMALQQIQQADDAPPAVPADTHASGVNLVLARPFTLEQPTVHHWRAEQPQYTAGVALVLQVEDLDLVHPRQGYEPVLYVGAQTAARLNTGHPSGFVVAVVPAGTDAQGRVDLDLTRTPIYFGDPALPEQVDEAQARAQLAAAVADGVAPPTEAAVADATLDQVHFTDDWELRVWAADLIESYSPQEKDLVSGLRAPRVGR